MLLRAINNMQNNHDHSRGYQFNGSVEAGSIGNNYYYGDKSEPDEIKLNIIQESLERISKGELRLKAKTSKKIRSAFIALSCVEFLIFCVSLKFFSSATDIIVIVTCMTSVLGFIFVLPHMKFIYFYFDRPKSAGLISYIGDYKFMRDEDNHYSIYKVTAKCIYDKGNCPGSIEIIKAPMTEAKLGMRIVGKCFNGDGHSYGIDINNLIAIKK